MLGEISLFPRDAERRIQIDSSDRLEIGYWLRMDETGKGYVTEATEAVLAFAASVGRFTHAEIRCDAANAASAAIPRRLGFVLASEVPERSGVLQVWMRRLLPAS